MSTNPAEVALGMLCEDPHCEFSIHDIPHTIGAHVMGAACTNCPVPVSSLRARVSHAAEGGEVPGEIGQFESGKQFEVMEHGVSGTTIQYLARVMKLVTTTDKNGKKNQIKFSSKGPTATISSASPVYRPKPGK
jgi:hypothetical protein